ncbi:hypothetical protein TUM12370_24550 [Salmonella enterica subsp. enterica serovar Choleraesuis]|nr:hypothetical protein TUM12370_24550 [Salmonella enterica subsp. enterica serovar Choleraesuis]
MYRVYLRKHDQTVADMFRTEDPDEALQRFADMVNDEQYDGQKIGAVISHNNAQIAFHRFDRQPGQTNYWRDNLDEIEMPARRVGRPTVYGAVRKNITISPGLWELAQRIGGGNASAGIHEALRDYERNHFYPKKPE